MENSKRENADNEIGMESDRYGRVISYINANIEKLLHISKSNPSGCGSCRENESNNPACHRFC